MAGDIDVGGGVSYRTLTCSHSPEEPSGAIVSFHDQDPPCEGVISWCEECSAGEGRVGPWTLHSLNPLHVEPSIACRTHPHHHGWIREGRWTSA
jgi:hypothetical protein